MFNRARGWLFPNCCCFLAAVAITVAATIFLTTGGTGGRLNSPSRFFFMLAIRGVWMVQKGVDTSIHEYRAVLLLCDDSDRENLGRWLTGDDMILSCLLLSKMPIRFFKLRSSAGFVLSTWTLVGEDGRLPPLLLTFTASTLSLLVASDIVTVFASNSRLRLRTIPEIFEFWSDSSGFLVWTASLWRFSKKVRCCFTDEGWILFTGDSLEAHLEREHSFTTRFMEEGSGALSDNL